MRQATILTFCLILLVSACTREDEAELTTTTTTTVSDRTTTTPPTETTAGEDSDDGSTATTETVGQPVEGYEVAFRTSADGGEVLWVVIEPGDYTAIDLEGFVARVRDELDEVELWELHVVDDPPAVDAARIPEEDRTAEEQALVEQHFLVSLLEGRLLSFRGPYADEGEYVLAS